MADKDQKEIGDKEITELDWISLRNDLHTAQTESVRTPTSRFFKKFEENPLVPIGCGLTTFALCYGLYSFSKGNSAKSQSMMRLRVMAQGFTVAAIMLGIVKTSWK